MTSHRHDAKCWRRYESCGEHHAHSYECGGGVLRPECPDFRRSLHFEIEARLARAREYIRSAADVAWDWGNHTMEKRLREMQSEVAVPRSPGAEET